MNNISVVIIFVGLISVLKYFEDRFCFACLTHGRKITSAVIGATVIALFTELLDDVYAGIHETNKLLVLILPVSFIFFFFLHRHIYQHKDSQQQSRELNLMVKTAMSFSDVLIGILAVSQIQSNLLSEFIFLSILLSYELIEQLSLHIIHEENSVRETHNPLRRILFSIWPLLGFFYAYLVGVSEMTSALLLAIYAGTAFSIIVREIFSQERKILPVYFLTGTGLFILLFFINIMLGYNQ